MKTLPTPELEALVLKVADIVTGPGSVERVAAEAGVDMDGLPAYHITFQFEPSRSTLPRGLAATRIRQRLRDELEAIDDHHDLVTRFLSQEDWNGKAARG